MQVRKLLADDEGVSPVIGVILMVAITVILAAVIAAFVLGLGDSDDVAPQTSFDWDYENNETLDVTATSGDTIDPDNLEYALTGAATYDGDSPFDGADEVSAGSSDTIDDVDVDDNEDIEAGDELQLVWESDDGDESATLASFEFPDDEPLDEETE